MACPAPFDAFRVATESLPDIAYLRGTFMDPFTNLILRGEYPRSAGLTRSTFVIERSEPTTDEPAAVPVTLTSGGEYTGSCANDYNDVNYGFTETTFSPERIQWKGPIICQDDLFFTYKSEMFLEKYIPAMSKNIVRQIANRMTAIYTHFVPKAVANSSFSYSAPGTGTPPTSPSLNLALANCELSQEMLDATAIELNEEGAFEPNTNGWITLGEDGPIYPLLIGQQMSQNILLDNSELRQDRRFADEGKGDASMLFKRLGASRVIKNFRHIINPYPPRYSFGVGGYTRVPTWDMDAATKGFGAVINPDWRSTTTAPFEAALVLNPWVFRSQVIRPVNSAAGLNWSPKSYMGELVFRVGGALIEDPPCYDPQMKLGRHFAEFMHAAEPIFPEYGRWIIFRRCPANTVNCITCS